MEPTNCSIRVYRSFLISGNIWEGLSALGHIFYLKPNKFY